MTIDFSIYINTILFCLPRTTTHAYIVYGDGSRFQNNQSIAAAEGGRRSPFR